MLKLKYMNNKIINELNTFTENNYFFMGPIIRSIQLSSFFFNLIVSVVFKDNYFSYCLRKITNLSQHIFSVDLSWK